MNIKRLKEVIEKLERAIETQLETGRELDANCLAAEAQAILNQEVPNDTTLQIPVISEEELRKYIVACVLNETKDWTKEQILDQLLTEGFPVLDFENLSRCLKDMPFIFLPTMAVPIDDTWMWVLSGKDAVIVARKSESDYTPLEKE